MLLNYSLYLIIDKLIWAKDTHSEMQLKDIKSILNGVNNLDKKYIENWIIKLNLVIIYNEVNK